MQDPRQLLPGVFLYPDLPDFLDFPDGHDWALSLLIPTFAASYHPVQFDKN